MPKYVYDFTGDQREHFSFLPADPPSQWLEPGDSVTCNEKVEHPRLQLRKTSRPSTITSKPEGGSPTP